MCTLDGKTKGKGREKIDFRTGKFEKTQITWISHNTMPSTEHQWRQQIHVAGPNSLGLKPQFGLVISVSSTNLISSFKPIFLTGQTSEANHMNQRGE